jgi:hypothetical protein
MAQTTKTSPESTAIETIDLERLFKLRLTVARFGEMDRAGWWNTKGMLGSLGKAVLSRGFPQTHFLAQARVVFTVASRRCAEVFSPPGHFTLWSVPSSLEGALREQWMDWRDRIESFRPFFESLQTDESTDLLGVLQQFDLIDDSTREAIKGLRISANGNAILIPGVHKLDNQILSLLAAGFARGGKSQLVIPYAALEVAGS